MRRGERRHVVFLLATLALVGVAVYVVVAAASGADVPRNDALLLLAATVIAGAVALWGWRTSTDQGIDEARRRQEAEAALEDAREGIEAERREGEQALAHRDGEIRSAREEAHEERRRSEEILRTERALRSRIESARRVEREHTRQLSGELVRLHREHGPLGDPASVPDLVLRLAMATLEADKGLLLSRADRDGDGDLDLLASHGFEHDPSESRLAQRFAETVVERDTTIREDEPPRLEAGQPRPADQEIDNLVAIPIYLRDEFSGVVVCANRAGGFAEHDEEVLLAIGDHAGAVLDNARLRGDLRTAYLATVGALADAVEAKDPFLRGHSEEVAGYVRTVAERLELEPRRSEELIFASLLHDVGKIGISERILLKPSALTAEERGVVELHPRIGCRLIEQVPALRPMALAVLHHHERFDGDGYPSRLKGEEIPLEARIIGVADAFSAMTAERPYRGRMSLEEACAELERCAGTQFDPAVVRVFVEAVRREPPSGRPTALAAALSDPELQLRRQGDEPVLGFGSFAVSDSLTLLYSHSYFHEVAAAEAQRSAIQGVPFAVVVVELAHVPELNRTEGYDSGDAAIRAAARAIQQAAVRYGGTACRYGGRRLALLAPRADAEAAERIAAEVAVEVGAEAGAPMPTGAAAWREGEGGDDVVARAQAALRGAVSQPVAPPPTA